MEYVDVHALKELEALLEEEMPEVMGLYLGALAQNVQDIQQSHVHGNMEGLRKSAHALKGSSANVAAQEVARICAELEKLAKAGELEKIPPMLQQLSTAATQTRTTLAELGYSSGTE